MEKSNTTDKSNAAASSLLAWKKRLETGNQHIPPARARLAASQFNAKLEIKA